MTATRPDVQQKRNAGYRKRDQAVTKLSAQAREYEQRAASKPYWADGEITLYQGDCRDILPQLGPVDHVITDPPYEAEAHRDMRRIKVSDGGVLSIIERPLTFGEMDEELRNGVAAHVARLARRWVLTFAQAEGAHVWDDAYRTAGLVRRRWCVWTKPDGQPQYSGDRPGVGYETILAMHKEGASRWNGGGRIGVFRYTRVSPAPHPTTKPMGLMRELVSLFTDPGETILDPFAGSGTTLLAAKQLGRKAIGIELSPEYCKVAVDRLTIGVKAAREIDAGQGILL